MGFQLNILMLLEWTIFVFGYNFPYESVQLRDADVDGHPEIAFGVFTASVTETLNETTANCRKYPGDPGWPTDSQWNQFNQTLGGALIKSYPLARSCYNPDYNASACDTVRTNFYNAIYHVNDPASPVNQWTIGNLCPPPPGSESSQDVANSTIKCSTDGYTAYVVNATTVRHIQLAVNFARNSNIRLSIKNTGHDFSGKSSAGGSLSIWVHNLKEFEYLPSFSIGNYSGPAARLSAGLQSFELQLLAAQSNTTIVAPGGPTVGALGGFMQGGGHSLLVSTYGLVADQILSMEVVTADGRFITVDPENNEDLFFAMRGGGGGTWGVITSAITKAYDVTPVSIYPITFTTGIATNFTTNVARDVFWNGIREYFKFGPQISDAGGIGYSYIRHEIYGYTVSTNRSLIFTTSLMMPGMNYSEVATFAAPLIRELNKVGVNLTSTPMFHRKALRDAAKVYPSQSPEENIRRPSRLFPRENFEDPDLLEKSVKAIRDLVEEGGYIFHGNNQSPTEEVAGYPNNAVLPAYRKAALHAMAFDSAPEIGSYEDQETRWEKLNRYVQAWRDITPGSGAYMNEADVAEPNWQDAFYGSNYPRLLEIKQKWDPWTLFWVPTGVGSEGWEVNAPGGLPTQNGKLCKVVQAQS